MSGHMNNKQTDNVLWVMMLYIQDMVLRDSVAHASMTHESLITGSQREVCVLLHITHIYRYIQHTCSYSMLYGIYLSSNIKLDYNLKLEWKKLPGPLRCFYIALFMPCYNACYFLTKVEKWRGHRIYHTFLSS